MNTFFHKTKQTMIAKHIDPVERVGLSPKAV